MVNSWEPLYSGNYMKSKKANKKFDFKVFKETGPKTSLITDGTQQRRVTMNMLVSVNELLVLEDVDITKRLDYSSAIAVLGFSLIVSILRTFHVGVDAARVMVSAPVLALVTTHVLYINFYKLYYGWNMIVCVAMGVAQLFLWARCAAVSRHPSNWKLWVVVIASGLAMLLEIYDFPPYGGYFDAHSIWHFATVPLTILWRSFIRDDAEFRTSSLLKKSKTKAK
uniref:Post-GPI attachment to proteins factor 3 n=1 Tax=Brassica oleracea var. oleracea TaxID=109376 RepID=A0A0D3BN42_BRAOL